MKLLIFITVSFLRRSYQEVLKPVEEVCQNILACEDKVFQLLQNPGPLNQTVLFESMKNYISEVNKLFESLNNDKEGTYKVAKEVIDKKGASFVLDLPWNYFIARTDYGWNGEVLDDFLHRRLEVQEAWMHINKVFDPTADII